MTDRQLRDEVITLFLAGHETTANALTWTWVLLAAASRGRAPPARGARRGARRAAAVGRRRAAPAVHPCGASPSRCASIRPPGRWGDARSSTITGAGATCPAGSLILMSQWIVHRDAALLARTGAVRSRRGGCLSRRHARASPTSPSAAATACASAKASPGPKPCSSWRRSPSAGASGSTRASDRAAAAHHAADALRRPRHTRAADHGLIARAGALSACADQVREEAGDPLEPGLAR